MTAQRVLAFLALQDRRVLRTHVAATLWLDSSETHSNGSLRSAIWRTRNRGGSLVETSPSHLWLAPDVYVDCRAIEEMATRLEKGKGDGAPDWTVRAVSLDLLPDWTDDWVLLERERWRQVGLHMLESLCRQLVKERRYSAAIQAGLSAVSAEPLRESAQRTLIEAHLAEGNRCEAIRQYRHYEVELKRELDLSPGPELEALILDSNR
jgi:DNA-binding SARP family transcriptional activator